MEEKTFLYYRKAAGLTQQELADFLGVQKESVSQWETRKRSIPETHIPAIAKSLHITVDDIRRLNAIRKSDLERQKTKAILQISDRVDDNFPKDDIVFREFRKSIIWEIYQQDWTAEEKSKFANFIAKLDSGWSWDLQQQSRINESQKK